jgi:hypothetical protein
VRSVLSRAVAPRAEQFATITVAIRVRIASITPVYSAAVVKDRLHVRTAPVMEDSIWIGTRTLDSIAAPHSAGTSISAHVGHGIRCPVGLGIDIIVIIIRYSPGRVQRQTRNIAGVYIILTMTMKPTCPMTAVFVSPLKLEGEIFQTLLITGTETLNLPQRQENEAKLKKVIKVSKAIKSMRSKNENAGIYRYLLVF